MDGRIYQLDHNCTSKMDATAKGVISRGLILLGKDMDKYHRFLSRYNDIMNTKQDTVLELLCLGVLWHCYGKQALSDNPIYRSLLKGISKLRKKVPSMKPVMNPLKGFFITIGGRANPLFTNSDYKHIRLLTYDHMNQLIHYLSSMDEYHQEVRRLKHWYDYIGTIGVEHHIRIFDKIQQLTSEFLIEADSALGMYLKGIDYYRIHVHPNRRYKEDYHFTGKYREEYYLNMVGASLLNMGYEQFFKEAPKKMILLPTCMRTHSSEVCKAKSNEHWLQCQQCHNGCHIKSVTKLGKDYGYEVWMVGHSSSISSEGSDTSSMNEAMGIIGISCVLNLISGGWMLREKGVAAQCVLLSFSGCKNHWDDKGLVTEIFMKHLKERMGIGE